MRQAYSVWKTRRLSERTGLDLEVVWNRGGNGAWRLARDTNHGLVYVNVTTYEWMKPVGA